MWSMLTRLCVWMCVEPCVSSFACDGNHKNRIESGQNGDNIAHGKPKEIAKLSTKRIQRPNIYINYMSRAQILNLNIYHIKIRRKCWSQPWQQQNQWSRRDHHQRCRRRRRRTLPLYGQANGQRSRCEHTEQSMRVFELYKRRKAKERLYSLRWAYIFPMCSWAREFCSLLSLSLLLLLLLWLALNAIRQIRWRMATTFRSLFMPRARTKKSEWIKVRVV